MNITSSTISPIKNFQHKLETPTITISKQNRTQLNQIGAFPNYYCPNINFGSKFGEIDFDFDFYKASDEIINNHLDKMELTKDLTTKEQAHFKKSLFPSDKTTLLNFMFDAKPSILLADKYPYFHNNDKYDFVTRTLTSNLPNNKTYKSDNTFILNRELVKDTISENKELYSKRMGMDTHASIDEIYEKLIGEKSPLKTQNGYDDIIGVTLGFSPINSMLFQLERTIPNHIEMRKNRGSYLNMLSEKLDEKESPYKDFSDESKAKIKNKIESSKNQYFRTPDLSATGFVYIHIVPDEVHTEKIVKNSEQTLAKAQAITNK